MNTPQDHWENVYASRPWAELSWHQDTPASSIALIEHSGVGPDAAILDVGGGASRLVDHLLDRGYRNVSVLDISGTALAHAQQRLGERARDVHWIEGDVTTVPLGGPYHLWHDRAVFHFLTEPHDRARYLAQLARVLRPRGHVVLATFSLDGPEKCSGLPVMRYSAATLGRELGPSFVLDEAWDEDHVTPAGKAQRFVVCRFRHAS